MMRLVGLLCLMLWIAPVSAKDEPPASVPDKAEPDYRLAPEDVIEISVWREETLQKQVLVRPDGGISFPLVGGLQAAGRSTEELRTELTTRLRKYIPDPVVSVSVIKLSGYKIYVIGKVNKPGEFVIGRYVDVLQALSMAGGLTPFADEKTIKIVRKQDGNDIVLPFDYGQVRKGKGLTQNIQLRNGDTVVVP